jgi:hypothetical protein
VAVTRWTYLGLALLAVGFLVSGAGGATHLHEQQCQGVQFVTATNVSGTNGTAAPSSSVAYENLTARERRVFDAAREEEGGVLVRRGALEASIVEYRGHQYVVRTTTDADCTPWHPTRVVAPLGGGLALVLVGAALTRGRDPND